MASIRPTKAPVSLPFFHSTPKIQLGVHMCLAETSTNLTFCHQLVTAALEYVSRNNASLLSGSGFEYSDDSSSSSSYLDMYGFYDNNSSQPFEKEFYDQLLDQLNIYLIPIIIAIGVITNTLSIFVFLCTHLRHHSSSIYLASLAVSDSGFLVTLLLGWFSWFKIHIVHRDVLCQLIIYMSYLCSFLSVYFVMAFTVERYIAVVFPFKRAKLCSVRKAKICVGALAVLGLLMYSYSLWTNRVIEMYGYPVCTHLPEHIAISNAMLNADTIITFVIPSFVIIVLNVWIAIKIYQTLKARRLLDAGNRNHTTTVMSRRHISTDDVRHSASDRVSSTARHSSSSSSADGGSTPATSSLRATSNVSNGCAAAASPLATPSRSCVPKVSRVVHLNQNSSSSQLKTTRMLLVVSTVFVVLNAPSHAFKIHSMIVALREEEYKISETAKRYQEMCQLLYYSSFSINFFLYSAYAKRFRQGLKRLCSKVQYKLWSCIPIRVHQDSMRSNSTLRNATKSRSRGKYALQTGTNDRAIKMTIINHAAEGRPL